MGVRRSIVPRISLAGGITGFCTGMSMIWWTGAFDYPLIVGGKPFFSPMFAFPDLLRADDSFHGVRDDRRDVFPQRLPMHYHPVMKYDQIPPRHGRPVLHRHRGPRSAVQRADDQGPASKRRAARISRNSKTKPCATSIYVSHFSVVLTVSVLGFRGTQVHASADGRVSGVGFPGMKRQPNTSPQGESKFFADGRADRPLPGGCRRSR